jgi:hypothetical protein
MENLTQLPVQSIVSFYEGSYQFDQIKTELNVSPDFIEMKLAKQYEYRPTKEDLWGEIKTGEKIQRFVLIYGQGLREINFNNQ